jgi:hypothetical protein
MLKPNGGEHDPVPDKLKDKGRFASGETDELSTEYVSAPSLQMSYILGPIV